MRTHTRGIAAIVMVVGFLVPALLTGGRITATAQQSQSYICRQYQEFFTVPADVYSLSFDMYGGADGWSSSYGARVTGTVSVTPGEELEIKVGCQGNVIQGTGGWPNGGYGGGVNATIAASGGGGSTSIVADYAGSYEVIAIAGGAGGSTNYAIGGASGQVGDDAPVGYVNLRYMDGKGATQSAGGAQTCNLAGVCGGAGSYLQGGEGGYGGGGGGGYFGGSAGTGDVNYWWGNSYADYSTAGGGGSSYVSPTRSSGFADPQYYTGWSDQAGRLTLTWTPTPTTTVATTTTTTTTVAPATTQPPSTTSTNPPTTTTTTTLPSWSATPINEDESQIIGVTPFPVSGVGAVVVTNETGFTVSRSRVFTPRWRTRVYVGTFSFSLKATYTAKKKRMTYACTFPKFSTESRVASSNRWRWYQPPRGCTLPKELIQQLSNRTTTMTFSGTFTRRWATTGKTTRPDGSKIAVRRINVKVAASESVALN